MKIPFWIAPAIFTLLAFNTAHDRQQTGTSVPIEPESQRTETGSAPTFDITGPRATLRDHLSIASTFRATFIFPTFLPFQVAASPRGGSEVSARAGPAKRRH